ncbi:MAG: GIY-YIG nuclease family protein [Candidatus Acidiferrales bacterium]
MAIGRKGTAHVWLGQKIVQRAPQASGVYAIFSKEDWIYVGEAGDLRKKLIAHFDGENRCITQSDPIGFQFELVPAKQRAARKKKLIAELEPTCNRR